LLGTTVRCFANQGDLRLTPAAIVANSFAIEWTRTSAIIHFCVSLGATMKRIGVILLAAVQGVRMKSGVPKVLHPLAGKPLFLHTLETALRIEPSSIAVIIGHGGEAL